MRTRHLNPIKPQKNLVLRYSLYPLSGDPIKTAQLCPEGCAYQRFSRYVLIVTIFSRQIQEAQNTIAQDTSNKDIKAPGI